MAPHGAVVVAKREFTVGNRAVIICMVRGCGIYIGMTVAISVRNRGECTSKWKDTKDSG